MNSFSFESGTRYTSFVGTSKTISSLIAQSPSQIKSVAMDWEVCGAPILNIFKKLPLKSTLEITKSNFISNSYCISYWDYKDSHIWPACRVWIFHVIFNIFLVDSIDATNRYSYHIRCHWLNCKVTLITSCCDLDNPFSNIHIYLQRSQNSHITLLHLLDWAILASKQKCTQSKGSLHHNNKCTFPIAYLHQEEWNQERLSLQNQKIWH